MQEILKLIEGKWDMFGFDYRGKNFVRGYSKIEYDTEDRVFYFQQVPSDSTAYSLADFANNKSVCEALAKEYIKNNRISSCKGAIWEYSTEINQKMLKYLYINPNDAVGLAKLIKEWIA